MPLPWKKSKSSRISRFVTDLQQSPKHGGSLVVETGFPTSLIDLFVKNRDRLKKSSSKRINKSQTPQIQSSPSQRRIESSPPIPPLSLARYRSLPLNLDTALVLDDPNKIEENLITPENINDDNNGGRETSNSDGNRGGGCVLMVAVFKVFMVAVLALSAKKLAVGITISAFALLFLELAVTRVFTYFNLCPNAHVRIDSLIEKLIGNRNTEKLQEEGQEEEGSLNERRNKVSFEIIEEPKEEEIRIISQLEKILSLEKTKSLDMEENKEVEIIRYEKSKSQRLKSKIVKKIVPKKLRSYKKKRKMKKMKQKEEDEEEIEVEIEEEEEESMTEVSSLFSEERNESEISERDDIIGSTNLPLLETCGEIEEEEEDKIGTKGDVMKVISLIVIVLVGLLCGKVFAIGLTLSWCLILRSFCCKSQTQNQCLK